MRALIRLLVVALLIGGVVYGIGRIRYPGSEVEMDSGRKIVIREPERMCQQGRCVLQVMFYTSTTDRGEQWVEAEEVARWAHAEAVRQRTDGIFAMAVNPGKFRLLAPEGGRAFIWGWRTPGEFSYLGDGDLTGQFTRGPQG